MVLEECTLEGLDGHSCLEAWVQKEALAKLHKTGLMMLEFLEFPVGLIFKKLDQTNISLSPLPLHSFSTWAEFLAGFHQLCCIPTRPLSRFSRSRRETSLDGRGRVVKAKTAAGRCLVKSLLCSRAKARMKVEESWHIWAIKFSLELVVLEALDYHSCCMPQGPGWIIQDD